MLLDVSYLNSFEGTDTQIPNHKALVQLNYSGYIKLITLIAVIFGS